LIGELESLDAPAAVARLPAGPGHGGEDALEVLERMRAAAPDDPFWRGVAEARVEPRQVVVRFHEGLVPREVEVGPTRLECHLYDDEALESAKRAAAGRDVTEDGA
jgi:hypothetical protein